MLPCKLNRNHPKIENKINPVKKNRKMQTFIEKNKFLIRNYTRISTIININKNNRRNPTTQITNGKVR
jgi:hypothetical protein